MSKNNTQLVLEGVFVRLRDRDPLALCIKISNLGWSRTGRPWTNGAVGRGTSAQPLIASAAT